MGRWAGVVAVVAIAGGAIGGCGGDDEDGDEPVAAAESSAAAGADAQATDVATTDAAGTTTLDAAPATAPETTASDAGDAGDAGDARGAIEACSLLTEDEAVEALGAPLDRTGPTGGVGESICEWVSAQSWSIVVAVGSPDTAIGNTFEPYEMLEEPEPLAALPGAYYMGLGSVDFPADERHNYVQVVAGMDSRATAERLAALLTERITAAGS